MDKEFHYYLTFLVAARAGFSAADAETIAYAAQFVDDNDRRFEVRMAKGPNYKSRASQTINILKPRKDYTAIYTTFHFLPGDPEAGAAIRKDGKRHPGVTTPGSANALAMMRAALKTKDPIRIGIACHTFADTWAHQNFVGTKDAFNGMEGFPRAVLPNIGHVDAFHDPDRPATVWTDPRLVPEKREVDNRARFLDAAQALHRELRRHLAPAVGEAALETESHALRADLAGAVGGRTEFTRRAMMETLAAAPPLSLPTIPAYDYVRWADEAFRDTVPRWKDPPASGAQYHRGPGIYNWMDEKRHEETRWFRFQEAARAHHRDTQALLSQV